MLVIPLTAGRKARVLSVGFAATISLYLLVIFIAEPLQAFASQSANTVVQMTVTSTLSLTCTATVTLPSASGITGTTGTGSIGAGYCNPTTNDSLGYTLSWVVNTSTGTTTPPCTGNCYGTGHLLSNNLTGGKPDTILAFDRRGELANVPGRFDETTILSGSGSRWAARLRANSTTAGGGGITWGADGATEAFLNVGTGSAVNIAKRLNETSATGDIENFLFKVVIPAGAFQPTGTYKGTVVFTATDN
jgi:hypothetical protein